MAAELDAGAWPMPPVFRWLARTGGVAAEEMLRVFNCGIGMVLVVRDAGTAMEHLRSEGEQPVKIGAVVAHEGEAAARVAVPEGWLG